MNDELQRLKNLGKTSAQWLHAAGIHNAEDLRRLGAVEAYRAVRARGFRASRVLLYAIEGALLDIHWNKLPSEHKAALNHQLENPSHQHTRTSASTGSATTGISAEQKNADGCS
ncbi:MAG: TfoX/Sxy family protein [Pseudomonas sp.]|jgi:TfoX/Sxy family transcriptional regulator of competence genes|uniref:TfoX/Sxy family protein n=1 Tax=Serpens gallinarum TaxID=2763075 RepID=A0ABR8TQ15_9PSED|nr:TfoX/Sxy family protein [Serpens gallinarum]MBF0674344.1 TfoX/Sxy family protein [Pseudomonas sp.]